MRHSAATNQGEIVVQRPDDELRMLVDAFRQVLEGEGLPAALRFLNARTRHRFTALYRFETPWLRNVCMVDRENPGLVVAADCAIRESYCSYIHDDAREFAVEDASTDGRVVGHPKREALLAYCGVPVFDDTGRCIGTLCHFDPRPRLLAIAERPLLVRAAVMLAGQVSAHGTANDAAWASRSAGAAAAPGR